MSSLKPKSNAACSGRLPVLRVGDIVEVVECSGTYSGCICEVLPASEAYRVNRQPAGAPSWRENPYGTMYGERGRYTDFEPKKEVLLRDVKTGEYFGMFRERLRGL